MTTKVLTTERSPMRKSFQFMPNGSTDDDDDDADDDDDERQRRKGETAS